MDKRWARTYFNVYFFATLDRTFFQQDPRSWWSPLLSDIMFLIGFQYHRLCKWITPSLISPEGENKREGTCPPSLLSHSFVMLMRVRSSIPGTICPSSEFGPQALQTCPIVCVCPSRKRWVDMVFVAQKAPPSTARVCCSLAYMWWGGGLFAWPVRGNIRAVRCFLGCERYVDFFVWCHWRVTVGWGMKPHQNSNENV